MDVIDTKRLETAILYLQRITEGHNPVNNMPAEDDSVMNNPNVIRCMFFVKEVLEKVKKNDGYIGSKPRVAKDDAKIDFPIEAIKGYQYTGDKSLTNFLNQLNGLVDLERYKKLTTKPFMIWLRVNGFLFDKEDPELCKKVTIPTDKGIELGIKAEKTINFRNEEFYYITYNKNAQEFILENIGKILAEK